MSLQIRGTDIELNFQNIDDLFPHLERMYLGRPSSYTLSFKSALLPKVEYIFDSLISLHGWKPVDFNYEIIDLNG